LTTTTFDDLGESGRSALATRGPSTACTATAPRPSSTTSSSPSRPRRAAGGGRADAGHGRTDEHGNSNVLGGDDHLAASAPAPARAAHGRAACCASTRLPAGWNARDGRRASRRPRAAIGAFDDGGAWIDFRGPPGTIDTVSFSDLLNGRVDPALVRGRIVVVGASAATLQDVHPTPTSSGELMSGPEIEANAIYTATHGLPLRDAPRWIDLLAILALGLLPALASLRLRALLAALLAPGAAVAWLVIAQLAFDRGHVVSVAAPLFALALGTVATIAAGYLAERKRRHSFAVARARGGRARPRRAADTRDHPSPGRRDGVTRRGDRASPREATPAVRARRARAGPTAAEAETCVTPACCTTWADRRRRDLTKPGSSPGGVGRHAPPPRPARTSSGSTAPIMRMAGEVADPPRRWDGGGYQGLSGGGSWGASACAIFDALLSPRPYKGRGRCRMRSTSCAASGATLRRWSTLHGAGRRPRPAALRRQPRARNLRLER
jgi:hypothetical protein